MATTTKHINKTGAWGRRRHGHIESTVVCQAKGGECLVRSECNEEASFVTVIQRSGCSRDTSLLICQVNLNVWSFAYY